MTSKPLEIATADIEAELVGIVPQAEFDLGLPQHVYAGLAPAQFELLLWLLFKEQRRSPPDYDKVTLMVVGADEGRDVWLTRKGVPAGLIQCKLSGLSAPATVREIIKFLLFAEIHPELLPDPSNFHYVLALAREPSGATVTFFDAPDAWLEDRAADLPAYVRAVAEDYESFAGLDLPTVTGRVLAKLRQLTLSLIRPNDLNERLEDAATVRGKFFRDRLVIDIETNAKAVGAAVEEAFDRKLSSLVGATGMASVQLVDDAVQREIAFMRRGRFFLGFEIAMRAKRLAWQLTTGDFAPASSRVKASALAWCARWLLDDPDLSERLLDQSLSLAATEDGLVATAFRRARTSWADGLETLSPINTPMRRTAALQITTREKGPKEALEWFEQAGIRADELDPEGRFVLLSNQLDAERWDEALAMARALRDADYEAAPAALITAARAVLAQAIPPDLRSMALPTVPFSAVEFPLADDKLELRREACTLFERSAAVVATFQSGTEVTARLFALWLRLRDPATEDKARSELDELVASADDPTPFVPLAVFFCPSLDRAAVLAILDRQLALNPLGTPELAMAKFAILVTSSPGETFLDLEKHRDFFLNYLAPEAVYDLEIATLVKLDRQEAAKERLAEIGETIGEARRAHLQEVIDRGSTGPSTEDLEAAYERDPSTVRLAELVHHLGVQGYSDRFFELVKRLIAITGSLLDADRTVILLEREGRHDELREFLGEIEPLIEGSVELRSAQGWSLFREGKLNEALAIAEQLMADRDHINDRNLQRAVLIAAGRWPDLANVVEREWSVRNKRPASELIGTAQLAAQIKSPRLLPLLEEACAKAGDDAQIYASSYFLASQAGLEETASTGRWLQQAIDLSGDEGPMQSMSLEDLAEKAPDWNKQTQEAWEQYRLGQIPVTITARLLNRPILEFQLNAMVANLHQADPRRRSVVSAFSGKRGEVELKAKRVVLSGSSIITLSGLGHLEVTLKAFEEVHIPHSTLIWLFQELPRLKFHQPSLVKAAHGLRRSLAAKRLRPFTTAVTADPALMEMLGVPLAPMLSAARAADDERQVVVVRSGPLHKAGSLKQELAELGDYEPYLRSCGAIADKLLQAGHLTSLEHQRAAAYLKRQEQRWPGEEAIADDAIVYLDDLSVTYLRQANLLEKIEAAGFETYVSENEIAEADALIELEALGAEIDDAIEKVRLCLSSAIADGRVIVDKQLDEEWHADPNNAILFSAEKVDAAISDDRFMNQYRTVNGEDGSVSPMWTSLDLLTFLAKEGHLDEAALREARTMLRRLGYALMPVDADDLGRLVGDAPVSDNVLIETADLRAVRENLALIQMRGWIAMPAEADWMAHSSRAIAEAIAAQWQKDLEPEEASARSDWLYRCIDFRNWSAAMGFPNGAMLADRGQLSVLVHLVAAYPALGKNALPFTKWLETRVIRPLKATHPDAYRELLEFYRSAIASLSTDDPA